jgi:YYY domain-containing protein
VLTFLVWYISITLIGLVSFPITYRLFPALADRGYSLSRIFGLLVWGYIFWLLASLGIIRNDLGGLILGLTILIGLSFWALRGIPIEELRSWWRDNRRLVISVEALFLVAFGIWTIVRAANPEILGTEKPMELAFINAILNSPEFPPHDPWLSGYAISYYYFGYVMTAMIAKLTVTPGSIAFNLALSQTFALSAIAAYGVLYSLLSLLKRKRDPTSKIDNSQNLLLSLLGPTFILLISNLEGFLEVLHARGLFWLQDGAGQLSSRFWVWLDMKELSVPPSLPLSWIPSRYLWWWRASRVVQDYDLAGSWREVIDEFPFFSYLLGDLHPHVLVMPFALLALGLILNVFMGGAKGKMRWLGLELSINSTTFWAGALIIGGLAFLNTWDFPMYVFVFGLVYVARNLITVPQDDELSVDQPVQDLVDQPELQKRPSLFSIAKDFLFIIISLALSGVLLYLPFYIGFSSQAGGILPNLVYSTRGAHLWVMFGSLLLPIFAYLLFLRKRCNDQFYFGRGFLFALGLVISLWLISLLFGLGIASIPLLGNIFVSSLGGEPGIVLLAESLSRRLSGLGWITLILLLGLTIGYLLTLYKPKLTTGVEPEPFQNQKDSFISKPIPSSIPSSHDFVLLMILMGGLLVLFTEFFYLRDQFGSRMNTIFKFYYQTWIFWGLAAAFGTAVLLNELRRFWGIAFRIGFAILLIAALMYPFFGLWNKTNGFNPISGFTLDGTAHLENSAQEDMAGIRWLESAPAGVVIEAVGPQYSEYARVATISGHPNVLGWAGHESQWRGGRQEIGTREEDIETIYRSNSWEDTKQLLDMYNVRYIFIGTLEQRTYRVNEAKFERFLGGPVYKSGQVSIYEVPLDLDPPSVK